MRVTKDVDGVRLCNHCKGRKTCNCDICVQQGGACGQCGGLGHFVKVNPPLPPEFREKPRTKKRANGSFYAFYAFEPAGRK